MSILDPRRYQKQLCIAGASREDISSDKLAPKCAPLNISQFARDEKGAIAILFGLTFSILVAVVGGAVDYARWHAANEKTVQAAHSGQYGHCVRPLRAVPSAAVRAV